MTLRSVRHVYWQARSLTWAPILRPSCCAMLGISTLDPGPVVPLKMRQQAITEGVQAPEDDKTTPELIRWYMYRVG